MIKPGDRIKVVAPDKTVRGWFVVESTDPDMRTIMAIEPLPAGLSPGDSLVLEEE